MKILTFTFLIAFIGRIGLAQNAQGRLRIDSLKHQLTIAKHDTSRVLIMAQLCNSYRTPQPDSSLFFGQQTVKLAQQIHFPKGEIRALAHMGRVQLDVGSLPKSLEMQFKALQIADDNHLPAEKALPTNYIGSIYFTLGNHSKAINYYRQAMVIYEANHNYSQVWTQKMNIGNAFEKMNQLDSALFYGQQAYKDMARDRNGINPIVFRNLGNIQAKLGNNRFAMEYYRKGLQVQGESGGQMTAIVLNQIAKLYQKENQLDSSIYYAKKGIEASELTSFKEGILDNSILLSELYEVKKDPIKAFYYHKMAAVVKDSLFGPQQLQALQTIVVDEQVRQREAEAQRLAYQNKLKQYAFLTGLGVLLLIAFILYRNNQKEKQAKKLLQEQKDKVETTLSKLKATQAQLIQSEKLASLGELTAGIAHEIQNPLNFVNNFSEMSVELAKELDQEIDKEVMDKDLVKDLVSDLSQNQTKINQHGKRASSIVSGMLEHSRTSTGERALTDINKLADEYLRLSYHGMRAKDNSFNADYELIADENLPKIEVIPQDMGRVLLNLINNAFWACTERSGWRPSRSHQNHRSDYLPKVTISTRWLSVAEARSEVEIRVTDNGIGITDEVKAKIFQPFFTTKPTGQGTGLGLSLAYDIVTKGHGGTIEVESVEGEGTTFTVKLPVSTH